MNLDELRQRILAASPTTEALTTPTQSLATAATTHDAAAFTARLITSSPRLRNHCARHRIDGHASGFIPGRSKQLKSKRHRSTNAVRRCDENVRDASAPSGRKPQCIFVNEKLGANAILAGTVAQIERDL